MNITRPLFQSTALLAALFVLPVQAWMRQKDEIATKQSELDVLAAVCWQESRLSLAPRDRKSVV